MSHSDLQKSLNICPGEHLAIAFSGGGDSTALIHMLRERDPKPSVFVVDHNLRMGSFTEASEAKKTAQALGYKAKILTWSHASPSTGIQEKARKARYKLIGDACRHNGISHLVTGHTEDDQAETLLMRYDRNTQWRGAAGMRRQVYAPLWPQLARLTVHRPLLGISRTQLRAYNHDNGLKWSEDPSNANQDFTRIRARNSLTAAPLIKDILLDCANDLQRGRDIETSRLGQILQRCVQIDLQGIIHLKRNASAALLALLLRAASGTGGPISEDKLMALKTQISARNFKGATLGGAQITPARQGGVYIGPDPAFVTGRAGQPAIAPQIWPKDQKMLWASRFWITCTQNNMTVKPLLGHITKLPPELSRSLKSVPPAFRGSLP